MDAHTVQANNRHVTLEEVRAWPPTIDVNEAARALGVSRAHAYASIKRGEFPIKVIQIGGRIKIVTASLVQFLEGK